MIYLKEMTFEQKKPNNYEHKGEEGLIIQIWKTKSRKTWSFKVFMEGCQPMKKTKIRSEMEALTIALGALYRLGKVTKAPGAKSLTVIWK